MRTRGRVLAAAATLAAAGSLVAGTGPAAMAQRTVDFCPKNTLCLWQYNHYRGKEAKFSSTTRHASLGTFNNTASSMVNNTGHRIRLYSGKSYTGKTYTAKPDSFDDAFGNNHFDNTAESVRALG